MGEIGISRREYNYELKFWEMRLIIDGYNRRHHPGWEQARLVAYQARFAMGNGKQPVPEIDRWLRFPWEKHKTDISQDEISELKALMAAENNKVAVPQQHT